jgi:hypothetical protein
MRSSGSEAQGRSLIGQEIFSRLESEQLHPGEDRAAISPPRMLL